VPAGALLNMTYHTIIESSLLEVINAETVNSNNKHFIYQMTASKREIK